MDTTNDQCPLRGPGLTHVVNGTIKCVFCGSMVIWQPSIPTITRVSYPNVTPDVTSDARTIHASAEDLHLSLLDALLMLRSEPISEAMLGDPSRTSDEWIGHQGAVDAALDLIVPSLQAVFFIPQVEEHGTECISRPAVWRQIGRVPRRGPSRWHRA